MQNKIVVGVDIGGTHISAALVDLSEKKLLPDTFLRGSVNSQGTINEIVRDWTSVVKPVLEMGKNLTQIGVAMPGPFDENGVSQIKNQGKYESLFGFNTRELLAESLKLNIEDIRLNNDAACFLQGEYFCGAAEGAESALALTLGTGLGSSILKFGKAIDANLWCSPFLDEIAEEYISSRWLVEAFYKKTGIRMEGVKEICELEGYQVQTHEVFDEFGENLGRFLFPMIESQNPELIVLGGNLSRQMELFVPATLRNLPGFDVARIRQAVLGEKAALIGAASAAFV